VIKIGSFYISGKICEYNGPSVIPAGKVSLDISAKPQGIDNGLIVADADEGKGLEDFLARGNDNCLGPPPWSQPLIIYATTDKIEEQTELVFTVQDKSIFLLCTTGPEPCDNFKILGPIEVK
jgi:hypothetical protein